MDLGSIDNGKSGKGLLFVISSVSGGGKTSVIRGLMEILNGLELSVSHTTRAPRDGEVHDRDYHFTTRERFLEMIEGGHFLEWAEVYGQYYGTSRATVNTVTADGDDAVLDIDVQGAMQVKERRDDAILVFILAPGEEEQKRRLEGRGTESGQDMALRLEAARQELAFAGEYHYCVLNDDLQEAVTAVSSIIVAERCRIRNGAEEKITREEQEE